MVSLHNDKKKSYKSWYQGLEYCRDRPGYAFVKSNVDFGTFG